eukprot:CAMPEP_0167743682 /NCGR_PEP_ID=MMETSP0110_2-20121227/2149_1 /TAXON_ID=629695 /ORGANISM="Gymnochlora sp., Strain CCMP2014" /LENGTH=539 /DNA_ID=CAMNT_0007628075 /DNA_START=880 /DNA_END=2499 /DNA_ORIENTATION=-
MSFGETLHRPALRTSERDRRCSQRANLQMSSILGIVLISVCALFIPNSSKRRLGYSPEPVVEGASRWSSERRTLPEHMLQRRGHKGFRPIFDSFTSAVGGGISGRPAYESTRDATRTGKAFAKAGGASGDAVSNKSTSRTTRGRPDSIPGTAVGSAVDPQETLYAKLLPFPPSGSLKEILSVANEKVVLSPPELDNVFGFPRNLSKIVRLSRKLGEGAYAVVVKGHMRGTQKNVAVKILDKVWQKKNDRPASVRFIRRMSEEIACISKMSGDKCSVKVLGYYEDSRYVYIVMEYLRGGELAQLMRQMRKVPENLAAVVVYQILWQMYRWHSKGFVHTDVNSVNFLFVNESKADLWIKALDFGLSQKLEDIPAASRGSLESPKKRSPQVFFKIFQPLEGTSNTSNLTGTMLDRRRGTPIYTAPEVVEKCYNEKADIWSIGILAAQMILGRLPYIHPAISVSSLNKTVIYETITHRKLYLTGHPDFEKLTPLCQSFLLTLLCGDANTRPSAKEALEHPWLRTDSVFRYISSHPVLSGLEKE